MQVCGGPASAGALTSVSNMRGTDPSVRAPITFTFYTHKAQQDEARLRHDTRPLQSPLTPRCKPYRP